MGHDVALAISVDGRPRTERDEPSGLCRRAPGGGGRRYRGPATTAARHAELDAPGGRTACCAGVPGPGGGNHAPRIDILPRHRRGEENPDLAGALIKGPATV